MPDRTSSTLLQPEEPVEEIPGIIRHHRNPKRLTFGDTVYHRGQKFRQDTGNLETESLLRGWTPRSLSTLTPHRYRRGIFSPRPASLNKRALDNVKYDNCRPQAITGNTSKAWNRGKEKASNKNMHSGPWGSIAPFLLLSFVPLNVRSQIDTPKVGEQVSSLEKLRQDLQLLYGHSVGSKTHLSVRPPYSTTEPPVRFFTFF